MYERLLRKAVHTRRFTIRNTDASGWEVLDESEEGVLKTAFYDDWHRVERAKTIFAIEARQLFERVDRIAVSLFITDEVAGLIEGPIRNRRR